MFHISALEQATNGISLDAQPSRVTAYCEAMRRKLYKVVTTRVVAPKRSNVRASREALTELHLEISEHVCKSQRCSLSSCDVPFAEVLGVWLLLRVDVKSNGWNVGLLSCNELVCLYFAKRVQSLADH